MFGLSIFLIVAAVATVVIAIRLRSAGDQPVRGMSRSSIAGLIAGALVLGGLLIGVGTTVYTQDPGQAKVLRSWTGEVVGYTASEGLKFKAPWVELVDYDIRNQQVVYANTGVDNYTGGRPDGAQITVQDKEGVTADIDIVVRYSIDPDSVVEIYRRYQSQENFVARLIQNDVRSVVRSVPGKFTTLELLTNRAQAESDILIALETRWRSQGVRVESVALQEIRYSAEVKARFDAAQAARIEVEREQANLQAAEVAAQQKIVQAEAEAKANRLLHDSLTPRILQQRYLDTLAKLAAAGNLVITDGKASGVLIQR